MHHQSATSKTPKFTGKFSIQKSAMVLYPVSIHFFVDHTEPLEALECVREVMDWPLGELADGHEFLLVLEARRRPRSKSRSKSLSPAT